MASKHIQLPVRAKPARGVSKLRPQELYEELQRNEAARKIFRDYKAQGGYPDALLLFLWRYVFPPYSFRVKPSKRAIASLAAAIDKFALVISTLCDGIPPTALDDRVIPFLERLIQVRMDLDLWTSAIPEDRTTKLPGRPRGASPSNFAAAVLAQEFRKRFGRPRIEDIATLIQAVDPKRFKNINVHNLPREVVHRRVKDILAQHKKVVTQHWVRWFGKTDDWPGPQFAEW